MLCCEETQRADDDNQIQSDIAGYCSAGWRAANDDDENYVYAIAFSA
jgi:hypothetical protein